MRCPRCHIHARLCICAEIPLVPARTRVVIVRHALERWKPSNTARLAALAIPGSTVVDYAMPDEPLEIGDLDGACLLYPDGTSAPAAPRTLVVLDGTWAQTRRMAQRVPALRGLPRLSLPAPPPIARLRRPTRPDGMSTLEAIAAALRLLEGAEVAQPLDTLHATLVARRRAAAGVVG